MPCSYSLLIIITLLLVLVNKLQYKVYLSKKSIIVTWPLITLFNWKKMYLKVLISRVDYLELINSTGKKQTCNVII